MQRGIRAIGVAAAMAAIAACSSPSSQPTSPPPPLAPPSDPADTTVPPEPAPPPAETPVVAFDAGSPIADDVRPEGAPCSSGVDCESGVCEGEGCGPDEGRCAAKMRACTRDLRPYCGCDGQTFRTSGSCPGRVYAHRGECRQ